MDENKLYVNPDKTKYLLFNSEDNNVPVSVNFTLNTISSSESVKKPRYCFQSVMSMEKHI